ncbi:hypothetical protein LK994_11540 [Ferruginibacter lapsinanis]|uniref:hypothetical protein n=1 Tax=Ferruginibacter lapsinanis TaxID=563172 RepID=UPI001E58B11B|nr:hypothetical protein [Ferruginibacter lapsinanis]UEG49264.1 hypothetical protein LK994_11540 [Ferruginibacter lapsinanis]
MLPQSIKVVGKLQKILIIIVSFFLSCISNSQSQTLSPKDSINFKKDFENLLSKYKIDNSAYQINVQSNNQKGGQTAFIINNNYYGDPSIIPDSINYTYSVTLENGKLILNVSPRGQTWEKPLIGYDTLYKRTKNKVNYLSAQSSSYYASLPIDKIKTSLYSWIFDLPCTNKKSIKIDISENPNQFIYFGDANNTKKRYLYRNGKVVWYWGD